MEIAVKYIHGLCGFSRGASTNISQPHVQSTQPMLEILAAQNVWLLLLLPAKVGNDGGDRNLCWNIDYAWPKRSLQHERA